MPKEKRVESFILKYRLQMFIFGSIVIALLLATVSMALYNNSGAAQIDLSRPGYKSVRAQAVKGDGDYETFSANGEISNSIIKNFISLYKKQSDMIKSVDAFGGDPLSPSSLGIGVDPTSTILQ